ncbi:MAG: hypothetical protein ACRENU_04810 [Gemmatimonadaceae bacterium]
MPAPARLLNKLRETLGEEPARDLIAYIAEARDVSRSEVREVAELYLSRFDERLQSRLVEFEARVDRRFAEQDAKIEKRSAEQDAKMEKRSAEQDAKIEKRFADQDLKLERRFAEQDAKLGTIRIEFADRMAMQHKELLRWLFAFWAGTVIPLAGLMMALSKL